MYRDDHYRDPDLYDLEYAAQTEDILWYVKLAARAKGTVLELGCGNGRITLPLARAGHEVLGLDLALPMLDDLRRKLAILDPAVAARVSVSRRSFFDLEGLGPFPLVLLPFNALHHCQGHHDVLRLLSQVRSVLAPGGVLALDCYLPDPALYKRDPEQRYEECTFIDPKSGEALQTWERGWYDPQTQVHHVVYIYRPSSGVEFENQLDLRMFYPQELLGLIDLANFDVVAQFEDFRGTAPGPKSLKAVLLLRPRP